MQILESFLTEIAICRIYGGGGNRTRVSGNPDEPDLQEVRVSVSGDPARPSLCNRLPRALAAFTRWADGRLANVARGTEGDCVPGRGRPLGAVCTPAACEAEAMSTHIGETYPPHRSHRGGLRLLGVARPHCTLRHSDAAVRSGALGDRLLSGCNAPLARAARRAADNGGTRSTFPGLRLRPLGCAPLATTRTHRPARLHPLVRRDLCEVVMCPLAGGVMAGRRAAADGWAADGSGLSVDVRRRVLVGVRGCWALAGVGAVARGGACFPRVSRVRGSRLHAVAEHSTSVRSALTGAAA